MSRLIACVLFAGLLNACTPTDFIVIGAQVILEEGGKAIDRATQQPAARPIPVSVTASTTP